MNRVENPTNSNFNQTKKGQLDFFHRKNDRVYRSKAHFRPNYMSRVANNDSRYTTVLQLLKPARTNSTENTSIKITEKSLHQSTQSVI